MKAVLAAVAVVCGLIVVPSTAVAQKAHPGSAAQHNRLHFGQKRVGPAGGAVFGRHGTEMFIPPGTMKRRGLVAITPLPGGRFDFHITPRWSGMVRITMPPLKRGDVVGHKIGGVWLPEGAPGVRRVWVTHLSLFESIKAKARAAVCFLNISRAKILACLAVKLGQHVSKAIGEWIAHTLGASCWEAIAVSGVLGPGGMLLSAFADPACVGTAGEGNFQWSQGPTLPVISNPGGSQTPTVNPQGPTVSPQPAPNPTPASNPTPNPTPLPALEFGVMNADGGIYWRSGPDWNTAEASPGNGFYPNTIIKVACYQAGAGNVPGSADTMWEQASWVSGQGSGSGWINEHFINDGAAINQPSPGAPPCATAPPPTQEPPPPQTWAETVGGPSHTWTNYTNAGGSQGPTIPAYTTVQIACKVQGFRVADGDTWWYRIASSPWNGQYYVSADAFYNNGQTSGSLHGTPFVDPSVRDC